jgi:polyhydroxyalkanoate synthesis regulator phasin
MHMGITEKIKAEAMGLSQKAMEKIFADEKRAQRVAEVIGTVQRGKAALDKTQRAVMNQLNFASRQDFKDLGKQLSALKRRVRELESKLDGLKH